MTEFLSWLWLQAYKVYEWFGWLYEAGRNAALYAYSWAVNKAYEALQNAISFVWTVYGIITSEYNNAVAYLRCLVVSWINAVYDYALNLYNTVIGFVQAVRDHIYNVVSGWIETAKGWILSVVSSWIASLQNLINALVSGLRDSINNLLSYVPFLNNLISLLSPANLSKLIDFFSRMYAWLAAFVSDPLGITYVVIKDTFVTFFCYVMARALGTEQEQLPPPPVWWK
jgi:hypothetical protein